MRTLLKYALAGAGYSPPPEPPPTVLWTPANIGSSLALWLDADDASTVTVGVGAQQINDKSTNARNAVQITTSRQPLYTSSGLNGKSVFTFDGLDDFMLLDNSASMIQGAGYVGVWSVAQMVNNLAGSKNLFFIPTTTINVVWFSKLFVTSNATTGARRLFANGFQSLTGSAISLNTPFILGGEVDYSTATGYSALNGNTPTTGTLQTVGTAENTPSSFSACFGAVSNGSNYWRGFIAEQLVIVSSARPATSVVERIEGYLAHKWGLTANLPSGHPYKSTPPTV